MPDVFISHSSKNKKVADAVCAILEQSGVRCWVAPRDVPPGVEWGEAILHGLESCRVMLIVFSQHANESPQVRREVERAVAKGLIIMPFRIEDVHPTKAMEYFISAAHWLDAFTPPLQGHLDKLGDTILALLGREREPLTRTPTPLDGEFGNAGPESVSRKTTRVFSISGWVGGAAAACVALGTLLFLTPWKRGHATTSDAGAATQSSASHVKASVPVRNHSVADTTPAPAEMIAFDASSPKSAPLNRPVSPTPTAAAPVPIQRISPPVADPIIGKWRWPNNAVVTFSSDGSYTQDKGGGGKWECTRVVPRKYVLHWWYAPVDKLEMKSKGPILTMDVTNDQGIHFTVLKKH